MYKVAALFLALGLSALGLVSQTPAQQQVLCPTRPVGDSSNACASTAFVGNAISVATIPYTSVTGVPANTFLGNSTGGVANAQAVSGATATTMLRGGTFGAGGYAFPGSLNVAGVTGISNDLTVTGSVGTGPLSVTGATAITGSLTLNGYEIKTPSQCYDPRVSGVVWTTAANGTTNATNFVAAINAAISEAGNSSACIVLPPGTGNLCQVAIPNFPNGLEIRGSGSSAIQPCSTTTSLFTTTTSGTLNRRFYAHDFRIVPTGAHSAGTYFVLDHLQDGIIERITAFGGYNFLRLATTTTTSIIASRYNHLRNFLGTVTEIGGTSSFNTDYRSEGNTYDTDGCPACTEPTAYLVVRWAGGLMLGNDDAIHCGNCTVLQPLVSPQEITWTFINGWTMDTSTGAGFSVLGGANGTAIKSISSINQWSSSNANDGVKIVHSGGTGIISDLTFTNLRAVNNEGIGFHVAGDAGQIMLIAPTISGNSVGAAGTYDGIYLESGSGYVFISGGTSGDTNGFGNTQRYNINIAAGYSGNVTAFGVNWCGFVTASTNDAGPGTFTNTAPQC